MWFKLIASVFFLTGSTSLIAAIDQSNPSAEPIRPEGDKSAPTVNLPPRTAAELKIAKEVQILDSKIAEFYLKKHADPAAKENAILKEQIIALKLKLKTAEGKSGKDSKVVLGIQQAIVTAEKTLAVNQLLIDWLVHWKSDIEANFQRNYPAHCEAMDKRWKIQAEYNKLTNLPFPHPSGPYQAELNRLQKEKAKAEAAAKKSSQK
jgi:hypothetical protein